LIAGVPQVKRMLVIQPVIQADVAEYSFT
jgi:hypothetical protein